MSLLSYKGAYETIATGPDGQVCIRTCVCTHSVHLFVCRMSDTNFTPPHFRHTHTHTHYHSLPNDVFTEHITWILTQVSVFGCASYHACHNNDGFQSEAEDCTHTAGQKPRSLPFLRVHARDIDGKSLRTIVLYQSTHLEFLLASYLFLKCLSDPTCSRLITLMSLC